MKNNRLGLAFFLGATAFIMTFACNMSSGLSGTVSSNHTQDHMANNDSTVPAEPMSSYTSAWSPNIFEEDIANIPEDLLEVDLPEDSLTAFGLSLDYNWLVDRYISDPPGRNISIVFVPICSGCNCGYYNVYSLMDNGKWGLCRCVFMYSCGPDIRVYFENDANELRFCFVKSELGAGPNKPSCPLTIPVEELKPYVLKE